MTRDLPPVEAARIGGHMKKWTATTGIDVGTFLAQPDAETAVSGKLLWPERQRRTQTCVYFDDDNLSVKKYRNRNDNNYFNSGGRDRRIVYFNARVSMHTRL